MPLLVILPASAMMVALVTITWSLHSLGLELSQLRHSMRQLETAAVATNELDREASRVGQRATLAAADARRRFARPLLRNEPLAR